MSVPDWIEVVILLGVVLALMGVYWTLGNTYTILRRHQTMISDTYTVLKARIDTSDIDLTTMRSALEEISKLLGVIQTTLTDDDTTKEGHADGMGRQAQEDRGHEGDRG